MTQATCCSCPGKVLIAGGYLVLEKPNIGLVVATSSRFYSLVRSIPAGRTSRDTKKIVTVKSPQFLRAQWEYAVSVKNEWVSLQQSDQATSGRNPFVEIALSSALNLAKQMRHDIRESLEIIIVGDNDFYSQEASTSSKPFQKLNTTLGDVHKTGLGSSAAMVTSLVAAIMHHLVPATDLSKDLIHNLAQYAHSLAQGKVGSGFDVSSAMFGSHLYTRFHPDCLGGLMDNQPIPSNLYQALSPQENRIWSSESGAQVAAFALPPMTTLLLADVDAGSNTPSMVGKVNTWRKANPEEAGKLWDQINALNVTLSHDFRSLNTLYREDPKLYTDFAEKAATTQLLDTGSMAELRSSLLHPGTAEGDAAHRSRKLFQHAFSAASTMLSHRTQIREMGRLARVPIEPPEQERLLTHIGMRQPGVIGGGVPGAGGYDALFVLVFAPPSEPKKVLREVQKTWSEWTEMKVKPLSEAAYVHGAGVESRDSGAEGLRLEDFEAVAGLMEIANA